MRTEKQMSVENHRFRFTVMESVDKLESLSSLDAEDNITLRTWADRQHDRLTEIHMRFDAHMAAYEEYLKLSNERHRLHDESYTKVMESISALTIATKGIVTAWQTANNVRNFVVWISAFGAVFAFLVWAAKEYLK